MLSDAQRFWDAIVGKVKQVAQDVSKNAFRCERYEVTTAPNGSKIGVTLPMGTKEIFLPYSQEVSTATVGQQVLVVWWGSMSNAKVYYYADGYRGCVFPIGYIYISASDTDPGTIFGGQWQRIQDTFLLAAGANHSAGSTGGSDSHTHTTGDHTLTVNEMPGHTHMGRIGFSETGFGVTIGNWAAYLDGGSVGPWGESGSRSIKGTNGTTTLSDRNTRHLVDTLSTGGGLAHNHGNTGSQSNMPPYLTVYMWERIA